MAVYDTIPGFSFQTCHIFLSTRLPLLQQSDCGLLSRHQGVTFFRQPVPFAIRSDLAPLLDRPVSHRRVLHLQRPTLPAKQ